VDTTGPDAPRLLFAYGTLKPGSLEAATAGVWSADAVRGRMFDLGPYPALADVGDPSAGWVEGFVRPVGEAELREWLDPYEGVAQELFRRVATMTQAGCLAWVYVYARAIPRDARGPIARWDGPRAALRPGNARENLDDGLHDRADAAG
jgi:gamma-glutamylcyclotransferase (GGCT)/AIG2-like uncharacterized protein YtfP